MARGTGVCAHHDFVRCGLAEPKLIYSGLCDEVLRRSIAKKNQPVRGPTPTCALSLREARARDNLEINIRCYLMVRGRTTGKLRYNYRGIRSRASDRCDRATDVSKDYIRPGQEGPRDFLLVRNSGVVVTTTGE